MMRVQVTARRDLHKVQVAVYDDDPDSTLFYDALLDRDEFADFERQVLNAHEQMWALWVRKDD